MTQMPLLFAAMLFSLVAVPLYGNFVPARVSFLPSMRYYAGNWAYNIWLIRKGSEAKLDALTKSAGTMREQLARLLDDDTGRRAMGERSRQRVLDEFAHDVLAQRLGRALGVGT